MALWGSYEALEVCGAGHSFDREVDLKRQAREWFGDRGRALRPPSRLEQKRLIAGNRHEEWLQPG